MFENRLLGIIVWSECLCIYPCGPFLGYLFICVYIILRDLIMHSILYLLLTAVHVTSLEARQGYILK